MSDGEAPSKVTGVAATGGKSKVSLTWDAATDNVGVTAYRVRVRAIPTKVTGCYQQSGNTSCTLFWSQVSDDVGSAIVAYRIYQSDSSDMSNKTLLSDSIPAGTPSYQVTGLTNYVNYYFTVEAGNLDGYWGAPSDSFYGYGVNM
jgi:hypothetical protein